MNEKNAKIDQTIANVLAAKENLRNTQKEARKVLYKTLTERKRVDFRPSDFWKEKYEKGTKFDRADVLADEGVDFIEFADENSKEVTHYGDIIGIELTDEGLVEIRLLEHKTFEETTISGDDTWDADILLEFVRRFSE